MDQAAAHQRTMKEFLEMYNRLAYHCFESCISNFNQAKATPAEFSCINTCVDKLVGFNQRHMSVFVEHQNLKHKMAAKAAAEAQAQATPPAVPPTTGEATPAVPPTSGEATPAGLLEMPEQGSAPLTTEAVPAAGDESTTKTAVPENVSYYTNGRVGAHLKDLQSERVSFQSKSIVDQFLDSGNAELKFV